MERMASPRWQVLHSARHREGLAEEEATQTDAEDLSPHSVRRLASRASLSSAGSLKSSPAADEGSRWEACRKAISEQMAAAVSILVLVYTCVVYNLIYAGRILPAVGKGAMMLPFSIAFNILWCLTFWSWLMAHMEDPGTIPERWREFVDQMGDGLSVAPPMRAWSPGKATFCNHCGILRPERSHHCSTCGVCLLRLDHHCPFIKNCVGLNNHKYFLLLLIYGALTSVVGLGTALPELALMARGLAQSEVGQDWEMPFNKPDAVLFVFFGSFALLFVTLFPPMVMMHLPLACHNQTKIENSYENMPNPYDLGSTARNLAQLFGAPGPDWLLPVRPWRPLSDGVAFARGDLEYPEGSLEATLLAKGPRVADVEKLWRIRYQAQYWRVGRQHESGLPNACSGCI